MQRANIGLAIVITAMLLLGCMAAGSLALIAWLGATAIALH